MQTLIRRQWDAALTVTTGKTPTGIVCRHVCTNGHFLFSFALADENATTQLANSALPQVQNSSLMHPQSFESLSYVTDLKESNIRNYYLFYI